MATKNLFKYAFMLMVIALGTVSFTSCGSDDDDSGSGSGSATGIYGVWKADVSDNYSQVTCTVTITSNSMDILWYDTSDITKSEEEVYDSFSYNETTKVITAHYCKKYEFNADGSKIEKAKDSDKTYYVIWIDNNHIQIGKMSSDGTIKVEDDFGTLTRQ